MKDNTNDFNFNILTDDKLVWLDKSDNINLTFLKPNNDSFIYKSITPEIEYKCRDKIILIVDKKNYQISIAFIYSGFYILIFYDSELNFKKGFEYYRENSMIYLLNKNLYILFGYTNIFLIDPKYLSSYFCIF